MRMLHLLVFLFMISCALFSPTEPPLPDDSSDSSDPLNLKGLFMHPNDSLEFTLYSELISPKDQFFTDNGKSSFINGTQFVSRLEYIKNAPEYKDIAVLWSGAGTGVLLKDGSENELPERTCRIYLPNDTLEEKVICRVQYNSSSDMWQLTYWEVIAKNGNYSFFNPEQTTASRPYSDTPVQLQ